jgi:membrane associated rhomboid family serine protease
VLIPLRDVIPSRLRPWGASALILLFTAAFLVDRLEVVLPSRYSMAAAFLASPGWVTFVANALAAWLFGETVEGRLGHGRFLLLAAGGAVAGGFAPGWAGRPPLDPAMGASAATGAIVAAYLVLHPGSRVLVLAWLITAVDALEVPVFFFAGLWALAQCFHALSPFTDTTGAFVTCAGGIAWGLATVGLLKRPVDWRYTPRKNA